MARPRGNRKTARLSVSLDVQDYTVLVEIARKEDVSVAWIVRRAINDIVQSHQDATTEPELPLAPNVTGVSKAGPL